MNSPHAPGDPAELAALYVAGAMPAEQQAQYELHLAGGCEPCAAELRALSAVAGALYDGVSPIAPPPELRSALLERIEKHARQAPDSPAKPQSPQIWHNWPEEGVAADLFVRRAGEGAWEPVGIEGIEIRRLFVDRERDQTTMLVRMAPGTAYPRHIHHGPEECYVLQGELLVGDDVLHAGDYQRARPSSRHAVQSTTTGCLLLIVSSMSDELE